MKKEMTFEAALKRLEEIVVLLENGETPLEDSLKLFQEGAGLAAFCEEKLKKAEQTVERMAAGEDAPVEAAEKPAK